jgi:Fe-S-cluster-containing hydrogenase component 2
MGDKSVAPTRRKEMKWDREAEKELGRVPFLVRPLARRKIEERVRAEGRDRVKVVDYRQAESRFHSVAAGKSERELAHMVPRENEPGVPMVVVETCHHELSGCPHPLIDPTSWRTAVERWIAERNVSERLRARVGGDKIFFHHKFRVSISGCPNGCSRPRIADVGLWGTVRPEADPAECRACAACAEVCPDGAVTVADGPPVFNREACLGCERCREACPSGCILLSEPVVRVALGGKLGRHPRLAVDAGEVKTPEELIALLTRLTDDYIQGARPEERFADWHDRTQGGAR